MSDSWPHKLVCFVHELHWLLNCIFYLQGKLTGLGEVKWVCNEVKKFDSHFEIVSADKLFVHLAFDHEAMINRVILK